MLLPIVVSLSTLPYLVVVITMLAVEVVLLLLLVPRGPQAPTLAFGVLVLAALVGSAGALLGVFWAVLYPNLNSLTIVFEALGISMGFPPGLWMISIITFRDERIDPRSVGWPLLLAVVATIGEILMGLVFAAAAGPLGSISAVAAATLDSPWYLWSSVTVMAALLAWLPLDSARRWVFVGLAGSGVAAPWVLTDPIVGAGLMTGAMAVTFLVIYGAAARRPAGSARVATLLPAVVLAYLAMSSAGVAVAVWNDSDPAKVVFGAVMTAVMLGELRYLLSEGFGGAGTLSSTASSSQELPASLAVP